MLPRDPPCAELISWKEISAHLGVGVRTAQGWERTRGLPVRRLPGGRGQVRADPALLDAWLHSAAPAEPHRRRQWLLGFGIAALCLIGGAVALALHHGNDAPARYRIEDNTFIVLDDRGRELWRKTFEGLLAASYAGVQRVWFGDLDEDGRTEVLFAVRRARPGTGVMPLICYEQDGRERWRYAAARPVESPAERFSPDYTVAHFAVVPGPRNRRVRIIVSSVHNLYYPTQIAALTADGRLAGEYWHSGHIDEILVADLQRNGRYIAFLAGINNGSKVGTVIALDPERVDGASVEENTAYQLQGFPPGQELARILFPRSCINMRLEPFGAVDTLWQESGRLTVLLRHRLYPGASAGVYYHFNPDLTLRMAVAGSGFEQAHRELFAAGVLDHAFSRKEAEALREVRYLKSLPKFGE